MSVLRTTILVALTVSIMILPGCSSAEEPPETQVEPASGRADETPASRTEERAETDVTAAAGDDSKEEIMKAEPARDEPTPKPAPKPAPKDTPSRPAGPHPGLMDPSIKERAPDRFRVKFTTTKGDFVVEVERSSAPAGADRFYNLVRAGFFQEIAFFRAIEGFMVQFGIHGDPKVSAIWRNARIPDDPVVLSNTRGTISFATAGPNTRTSQLFINYGNNAPLDRQGFSPFGRIAEGMEVVDSLYKGYGEGAPRGAGPDQSMIQQSGNSYLKSQFPRLDYIKSASLMK